MTLSNAQVQQFQRDGYCVGENAVTPEQLESLRSEIARWVEESRAHDSPFGEPTLDGRARFDMGEEHCAEQPALRRVNNPSDISPAYYQVMSDAPMVDMVNQLIGPNLKFHHCKINLKLPASHTEVGYHQDFAYTPHTNSDVVTALLMLDDMTEENGCLGVIPGSHRDEMHSLFTGDQFTGVMGAQAAGGPDLRPRGERLSHAHPSCARLGSKPFERLPGPVHLRLYCGRRVPTCAQPHGQPERRAIVARRAHPHRALDRGFHRAPRAT